MFFRVTYTVSFGEAGLPSDAGWSVTLGGSTRSATASSIAFVTVNGTYSYSIADVPGWHQTTLPYSGSVTVGGLSVSEPTLVFTQVTYAVTFTQSGLPSGTSWSVTVIGAAHSSTSSSVSFTEPNGTYTYSIADVPGWHQTRLPYAGSVTVNGVTVIEPTLMFTQVTYTVTFVEEGLADGLTWSLTVNGVAKSLTTYGATDTLAWTGLANGTYNYGIADVSGWHQTTLAYSGSLAVSGGTATISGNGSGYSNTLVYTQVTYTVAFTESGLPTGTSWSVTVSGTIHSSTSSPISFTEPNGTYAYSIADVRGRHQTALPYAGTVTVNGATVIEPTLAFTQVAYTAMVRESGLPSGLTWTGTVNGVVKSLATDGETDTLSWTCLANGTYAYCIADVSGWHQTTVPYSGCLSVNGGTGSFSFFFFV